ncbi:MAG TPA: aromatic ring-hydroxylating dioxygenase subunit alpha [Planctomicrobium sp.]|nr:aromatic ring-hydroxylating dioxygenase subunit alpha [Planctomicrobium sp.]
MYQSPVSFEPPLSPRAYHDPAHAELEKQHVFRDAWHLVSTGTELAKPGQFIALTLFDIPIVVRNFDGELVALRNVCAHRQAIIARKPSGCSPTLRCPYHGWEYGSDGKTRKLPGASNFPKFKHDHYCLDKFHVDQCGDLVFIRLSDTGPTLREWIGDNYDLYEKWFAVPDYTQSMSARYDMEANWKIPVEGSLESYHIPCIHPNTFHEDPGEKNSTHFFFPTGTSFQTIFLAPRWIDRLLRQIEQIVLKVAGVPQKSIYDHHHIFPHLLISHNDVVSLAQVVYPKDATSSFTLAMQYGLEPKRKSWWRKRVTRSMGKLTASLTKTILAEDRDVFPLVQAGVQGANKAGLLGRCEERLQAIQKYIADRIKQGQAKQECLGSESITGPDAERSMPHESPCQK